MDDSVCVAVILHPLEYDSWCIGVHRMIAEQAYKGYPKLTETELYIRSLIVENPDGIHINSLYKKYPSRKYALINALKRLEAFKIVFNKGFVWYPLEQTNDNTGA